MNALTRWDPFKELDELQNHLSTFFGRAPVRRQNGEQENMTAAQWAPPDSRNSMKTTSIEWTPPGRALIRLRGFRAISFLIGILALTTSCVERRVEYVPAYQNQRTSYPSPSTNGQSQAMVATNAPGQPAPSVALEAPLTPPAPQVEVVPVAPGPEYVWAPGYWAWNGGWVWIGGRWVVRPYPGAIWVGGHWGRLGRGYVWVRGHWR